jgi:hypothetical protein
VALHPRQGILIDKDVKWRMQAIYAAELDISLPPSMLGKSLDKVSNGGRYHYPSALAREKTLQVLYN